MLTNYEQDGVETEQLWWRSRLVLVSVALGELWDEAATVFRLFCVCPKQVDVKTGVA